MGIAVGHIYYYCEDIYPYTLAGRGRRVLHTPRALKLLVGQRCDRSQQDDTRFGPVQHLPPQGPQTQAPPPQPPTAHLQQPQTAEQQPHAATHAADGGAELAAELPPQQQAAAAQADS
eukprot:Transcript_10836.p4 GENE.Transcript_10836~~Transcript_10836.p4  ORF type:complete len:118 (-),score=41.59 Transcript_10836:244-597(-)